MHVSWSLRSNWQNTLSKSEIASTTYNKDKLNKYRLNFLYLGSSAQSYIYWFVSYAGKLNIVTNKYITKVDDLVAEIVHAYEHLETHWRE